MTNPPTGPWRSEEWRVVRHEIERVVTSDFDRDIVASSEVLQSMPLFAGALATAPDPRPAMIAALADVLPERAGDSDRAAIRILSGVAPEYARRPYRVRRLDAVVLAAGRHEREQHRRGQSPSLPDIWFDDLTSAVLASDARLRADTYDERTDGSYLINRWSRSRRLAPGSMSLTERRRRIHVQPWFDHKEYEEAVAQARAAGHEGEMAHVVDWRVDHRESDNSQAFHLTVERVDYAEAYATYRLLELNPRIAQLIDPYFDGTRELHEFAPVSPPAIIWANIAVLDRDDNILVMQRSQSVSTFGSRHTVGFTEGMKLAKRPTATNRLFGSRRGVGQSGRGGSCQACPVVGS